MSLKNILKKGSIIAVGSALFLTFYPSQNIQQTEVIPKTPETNFYYSEIKKQVEQQSLRYNLKIYLVGFEIINKTMKWDRTITEDSQKLESIIEVSLRASLKYWGNLMMRKIDYKDSQNLERLCEEYSYSISDGHEIKKGEVTIYPNQAEIQYEDKLIIKSGNYKGVLSFLEDIMSDDLKVGEHRKMAVLFGKDVYQFDYKVVFEEILYEKYVEVQYEEEVLLEGQGKSYETYRIDLEMRKEGSGTVRKDIHLWIGKEGKHKGKLVKVKVDYNWAVGAELILKDLF